MRERRVLATDGVEDFWFEEGGPFVDVPTKTADLQSTHTIVFAKVRLEHNGLCFGRRRTFSAGLALASIVYTGPVEPDEIQQDFTAFIGRTCELKTASCFFFATDDQVRDFHRPLLKRRHLHELADSNFPIDMTTMLQTMSAGSIVRHEGYQAYIAGQQEMGNDEPCWYTP